VLRVLRAGTRSEWTQCSVKHSVAICQINTVITGSSLMGAICASCSGCHGLKSRPQDLKFWNRCFVVLLSACRKNTGCYLKLYHNKPFWSNIVRCHLVWLAECVLKGLPESLGLAERNRWSCSRSEIVWCWDSSLSTNIKHTDDERFKGLVFRLIWFVYGPVMQMKALNLKLYMKNSYVIFFYCLRFSAR
jgi:hypothetical protein